MIDEIAEIRLLASCIDNPDYLLNINVDLFTRERIALFQAMRDAFIKYGAVTNEGMENFFGRSIPNELESARGSKPQPLIDRLVALAKKRQLAEISNKVLGLMNQSDPDLDSIYSALSFKPIVSEQDSSLRPGIMEFVSDLNQKRTGQYRFVQTGIRILDHLLGGEWPRKALTVILGKGGGGKTALIGSSLLKMATLGHPVLFVSLEMTKDRMVSRFIASMTDIDNREIKAGRVTDSNLAAIDEAVQSIQALPIYIVDSKKMTSAQIVELIRRHKEQYGIEAVFIDYLQIIDRDETNDSQSLGRVVQDIRDAAVKYDLAAVVLSQQNRGHEGQDSIFGSARVSQIADVVFEIIPSNEDKDNDDSRIITIDFHKNRDGPLGSQSIVYRPKYLRYEG